MNELLERLLDALDEENNFTILEMAPPVLKLGLDPRPLMQWLQDQDIACYNERNIWERKIDQEKLKKSLKRPSLPKPDLKMVKMLAGKYLKEKK
jgi:hypothetical protein